MQNLPIFTVQPAAQPVASMQTSSPADNHSAAQASEPFGNVLARQRSNADAPQSGRNSDAKQPGPSAATNASAPVADSQPTATPAPDTPRSAPDTSSTLLPGDLLATMLPTPVIANSTAPSSKDKTRSQTPTPDASGTLPPGNMLAAMLPIPVIADSTATPSKDKTSSQALTPDASGTLPPGDMLAAMLPSPVTANSTATPSKDKTRSQAPTQDGSNTLPSDMLATMLPATAATSISAANEKVIQESTAIGSKTASSPPIVTTALGATPQSITRKAASGTFGITPADLTAPGAAGIPGGALTTGVNTNKESTFAAALETLGKDGVKIPQLDAGTAKAPPLPPAASTITDSLLQSGAAPIATNHSGAAPVAQAVINTPVVDPAWGNEFNQKITWMATRHEQTAELHLNPPNLGPLDVVLKVSGDQATALFTSPHAAVRDAVEQALPQLRNMLADNGISLGNAMVSDQSPKDQQAWQANQQHKENGSAARNIDTVASGNKPAISIASLGRSHQGMVDTFA